MKNVIPIVMAGVIGIYGLIVGVIIGQAIPSPNTQRDNVYSTFTGMAHLCAGLCCGCSGLAAGICIGIVGDYGIRAVGYRASQITLFPVNTNEAAGYSTIPESDRQHNHSSGGGGGDHDDNF
jgi:F0F1-type ATP synthase membrane subunit c/vacuolar-type H+-ATPase subunit K